MEAKRLHLVSEAVYQLDRDYRESMRVPVRVVADADLLSAMANDRSMDQLVNVSELPGIERFAVGMPDMHQGYGFPVGGVAATRLSDGVISPGGIGFDINCGVRLLASNATHRELRSALETIVHEMSRSIPTGYGRRGRLALSDEEMDGILEQGAAYVIHHLGMGSESDLPQLESRGRLEDARAGAVSDRAKKRGSTQLGTLGGGNHFLEIQAVDGIFDEQAARAFGLFDGQITVLIHTGSRGLGHQVCTDYVKIMDAAMASHGISIPDRQLACAPFDSAEGQAYFTAMCSAANFAWSNRQVLTHRVREVFGRLAPSSAGSELRIVYDVAHNIAKLEDFDGETLCVHRKGATRAFGPSSKEIPKAYRGVGQPVFIPGSMGTMSFVLAGNDASKTVSLSSSCHGAGRALSRGAAKRQVQGSELRRELEGRGIVVRCPSNAELAEEAPVAYKDVAHVVEVVERAGIARKVARLRPLGVLKG